MDIQQLMDLALSSDKPQYVALRMAGILIITWLVAKIISLFGRIRGKPRLHRSFVRNIITVMIYTLGIVLIINQIPSFNNNSLATFLTGSGIIALALSLAAQESLGNIISGIVISASKSFEVGDRIRLVNGNITGYIEDMTMRHMVIRTFMNSRVIIPNSVINKDMIESFSFLVKRADGFLDVAITYDSDLNLAIKIMEDVVGAHPDFVDTRPPDDDISPKVAVFVRELGIYGVELRACVTTNFVDTNFAACSEIRRDLKLAYDNAGVKFAVRIAADV